MSLLFDYSWWRTQKFTVLVSLGLLALLPLNASDSAAIEEAEALFIEGSVDACVVEFDTSDVYIVHHFNP